jgi:3-phenylpropionate/trans-cinnamate dioxygenase ferredoxin component
LSDFVDVCALADISNGRHRAVDVAGRSVLVFRIDAGLHAIENKCTHLDFPLEGGRQIGCEIICRQHGARFDVRTGKVTGGPAVDAVRTYEVRLAGERVEIRRPV